MRAITFAEYGGPEVLHLSEVPMPEPGPGQVRVAVRRAGVNPLDWKVRSGAMASGAPLESPQIPGVELAGVVDAVGDDAEFSIGDEVFGWSNAGSYAEFVVPMTIGRKPVNLSWDDAAALPVAGETSLRVLRLLGVKAGELLLIHGASGAVGRFATQVAVKNGVTVIGTAGQHNLDEVKSLGAIPVRYGDGWPDRVREAASDRSVDAVFDAAGRGVLPDSIDLLGSTERVVTIADPAAFELGVPFSSGGDTDLAEALNEILGYVRDGLQIAHGASYPLEEAAAAQEESQNGHPGGKLTIVVS